MWVLVRGAFLACAIALTTGHATAGSARFAVFEFELIDTSLEGELLGRNQAEQDRLGRLADQVRQALTAGGVYRVEDIGPIAVRARASNLQACGACDVALARQIGADYSITGTVQKVSSLILNLNLYVRDTATGRLVASMSADIRSNTDKSWTHGLSWLIRHRLLAALETITK